MRNADDLELWRTFLRSAELGSFTRAAERAGVEVSSVSRQVGELESRLGAPLFLRSSRGLSLTGTGRQARARLEPLLAQIEEATRELRGVEPGLHGAIRLALPPTGGIDLFLPWIVEFQKAHPGVRFDLVFTHRDLGRPEGAFDLEVRNGPIPDDRTVPYLLGEVPRAMVASPAYTAAHGLPSHPRDLESHRMVLYSSAISAKPLSISRRGERFALRLEPALSLNNEEAISRAVLAGAGIEVAAPLYKCLAHLADGRLVRVLPDWEVPDLEVHLLRAPGIHPPAAVSALIEWFHRRWDAAPALSHRGRAGLSPA